MEKRRSIYAITNVIVLGATLALFLTKYVSGLEGIAGQWLPILAFFLMVILVYGIKSIRLYFLLLGQGMGIRQFLKQYCKVIPVSIVLPYKMGELFRIYCYGYQLGNYVVSLEAILLDRFVDTIALIMVAAVVTWILGGSFTGIIYFLLFFLGLMMAIYLVFPEIYKYWKRYFLLRHASKRNLRMLEIMERTNKAYEGFAQIASGKFIILILLSLTAWVVEIGGILLLNGWMGVENGSMVVLDYLSAALTGQDNQNLQLYVLASVVVMLVIYVILRFGMKFSERKGKKC